MQSPSQVDYGVAKKKTMITARYKRTWSIVKVDFRSKLIGYINNNWIGRKDDMKSATSYVLY